MNTLKKDIHIKLHIQIHTEKRGEFTNIGTFSPHLK